MSTVTKPQRRHVAITARTGKSLGLNYYSDAVLHEQRMYCCEPDEQTLVDEYLDNLYQVGLVTLGVLTIGKMIIVAGPSSHAGQSGVSVFTGVSLIYAQNKEEFREKIDPLVNLKEGTKFLSTEERIAKYGDRARRRSAQS